MLTKLYRNIKMMISWGHVTRSDDSGVVQKIQYQNPLDAKEIPRLAEFGFSSGLPEGSDIIILNLGGEKSESIAIATNNRACRLKGLLPGESAVYNQWGMHIKLTQSGLTVEANGQPVNVNNASQVTVHATTKVLLDTPLLQVTGDIVDNCDTNSASLKQLRASHDQHYHAVKNVQGGGSTINSETPSSTV